MHDTAVESLPAIAPRGRGRRELIVRIARETFARNGYVGTHVSAIAQSAGIRKSSFFHYFPDKDRLFAAAVLEELRALADEVERVDRALPLDAQLASLVRAVAAHCWQDTSRARLFCRAFVDADAHAEAAACIARIAVRLSVAVHRGVADGRVAQPPPGGDVLAVLAAVAIGAAGGWLPDVPGRERLGETLETRSDELRALAARMLGVRAPA